MLYAVEDMIGADNGKAIGVDMNREILATARGQLRRMLEYKAAQ